MPDVAFVPLDSIQGHDSFLVDMDRQTRARNYLTCSFRGQTTRLYDDLPALGQEAANDGSRDSNLLQRSQTRISVL